MHGAQLAKDLYISHLDPTHAEQLISLIKGYWSILEEHGTFKPVRGYQCVIDTGNAKPIAVKKMMYGPKETVIMRKSIAALAKVGHIQQIHASQWLFKDLLAEKPHKEHILNIKDFVWRFCVNYIPFIRSHVKLLPHSLLELCCQPCVWHSSLLLAV